MKKELENSNTDIAIRRATQTGETIARMVRAEAKEHFEHGARCALAQMYILLDADLHDTLVEAAGYVKVDAPMGGWRLEPIEPPKATP